MSWPDYPALLEGKTGRLVQLRYWDPSKQIWTMLVPRYSGQVPAGWVEVSTTDVTTILAACAAGHMNFFLR